MTCFAVIAGGGTSGHVLPALAVAQAILDSGHSSDEIAYFGARRGIETQLVPPTGLTLHVFDVVGVKRELSWSALRSNSLFLPKLVRAWRQARRLMKQLQPRVVISVGGYASLPAVLSARGLRIPIIVVTYDRIPGRSSALTSRFAAAVASAFPDSPLPRSHFTGAPVRRELRILDRKSHRREARSRLGVPENAFFIGVIGGSLGSGVLNEAVRDFVQRQYDQGDIVVRHIVGERFLDSYRTSLAEADVPFEEPDQFEVPSGKLPSLPSTGGLRYQVVGYEHDMAGLYAAVDVLIGRGGAGTVAEVAATGTPAVLIPWSGAADDHQSENVRWLADAGGAIFVSESSCREELPILMQSLRSSPAILEALGRKSYVMGEKNRLGAIGELIEKVALDRKSS